MKKDVQLIVIDYHPYLYTLFLMQYICFFSVYISLL